MNESTMTPDYSTVAVVELQRLLQETPEAGRDALVASRLHGLVGNGSDRAAELLFDLATESLPGVRTSTVATLAGALSQRAVLRCLSRLPATRLFQIRHICENLQWRESLAFIAGVRDGRVRTGPFISFRDEVLALGSMLAVNTFIPYEQETLSLHRSNCSETLFLFGAARSPAELLRELESARIHTWPRLNYDTDLAKWALRNPALVGRARAHVIAQNSARVIAELRLEERITLPETVAWLRSGTAEKVLERTLTVMNLPEAVYGAPYLKRVALRLCTDLSALAGHLSQESLRTIARLLTTEGPSTDTVVGLLAGWYSNSADLLAVAEAIDTSASADTQG
jgi:hypothetical protein